MTTILLSIFVADILPVFAIAGAGFLLARFAGADVKTLVRVVFYALLPCLVFRLLVTADGSGHDLGLMVLLAVLIMLAMGFLGYVAGRAARLDPIHLRAFLLVVMFSNGGNYGLPVVRLAYGSKTLTYAAVFFVTGSVMTYLVGAAIAGSAKGGAAGAFGKIVRMPALYGVALALLALWLGRGVPQALMRPVTFLSDASLPLMILILGMQLERAAIPERPGVVLFAVGISLFAAPLVALGCANLFGVTGEPRQAAVTLSAMPVAVSTTILALEYELAPPFVTAAVFVSTLASPLTLTPLIAYLQNNL